MFLRSLCLLLLLVSATPASAEKPRVLRSFPNGDAPSHLSQLVQGRDGALYAHGRRAVYRIAPTFRVIYRFDGTDGDEIGSLVAAEDGFLYGTTGAFSLFSNPSLFRLSYDGTIELLHRFPSAASGEAPQPWSLHAAVDGALYGTTWNGGVGAAGTVYRATLEGEVTTILDLNGTPYRYPRSVVLGHDGALWLFAEDSRTPGQGGFVVLRVTMGGVLSVFGPPLADHWAQGITPHHDGNYYFVVQDFGGQRALTRLSPSGESSVVRQFASRSYAATAGRNGVFYWSEQDNPNDRSFRLMRGTTEGSVSVATTGVPGVDLYALIEAFDGTIYGVSAKPRTGEGRLFRWRPQGAVTTNLPPLARPDFARPPEPGESVEIPVLKNDFDANRDPLSITELLPARHGQVTLSADGKRVIYTAPATGAEVDEFRYVISDGNGGRGLGRVSLRKPTRGQFAALLNDPEIYNDGHVKVALSGHGHLSGVLHLGGAVWRFAGTLGADNRFSTDLNSSIYGAHISLALKTDGARPVIAASITRESETIEATLTAPDLATARRLAGGYTFALPSNSRWQSLPARLAFGADYSVLNRFQISQGNGFGKLTVLSNGVTRAVGRLPDGERFACSNQLNSAGRLIFFADAYRKVRTWPEPARGWVRGLLTFRDQPGVSDADGVLAWHQPLMLPTSTIENWKLSVPFVASRFQPMSAQSALGATASLFASGGGLTAEKTGTVTIANDRIGGIAPLHANAVLSGSSGLLSGHFAPPGSQNWTAVSGVILQKQGTVYGQFQAFGRRLGTGRLELE